MSDIGDQTRQQIYDFIVQYKREHDGLSPTFDDIAEGCYLSRTAVKYHMPRMQLKGMIRVVGRRGIEIIGGSWFPPEESPDDEGADEAVDDPAAAAQEDARKPDAAPDAD